MDRQIHDKCIARGMSLCCVLCDRCTVKNSHLHGRIIADFLRLVFALLSTVRPMHKNTVVHMDGILANFSMQFLGSLCTARSLPLGEKGICMDGALANFSLT